MMFSKNFDETFRKYSEKDLYVPKVYKPILNRWIYGERIPVEDYDSVEKTHRWLKSKIVEQRLCDESYVRIPKTFEETISWLKENSYKIRLDKNFLLQREIEFGHILEKFVGEYKVKYNRGVVKEPLSNFIKDVFNISDSYARKVRWLGRLGLKYPKLKNITLTLNAMYQSKEKIDALFEDRVYAEKWKGDASVQKQKTVNKCTNNRKSVNEQTEVREQNTAHSSNINKRKSVNEESISYIREHQLLADSDDESPNGEQVESMDCDS
jgi:hypothetical protein